MSEIDKNKKNKNADEAVKTKQGNEGDVAVWVFTLVVIAAFVLLIVWAAKNSRVTVYGNLSANENYRYGSGATAELTLTNGYAAQGKDIVWFVDDNEIRRDAYMQDVDLSLDISGFSVGQHKISVKLDDEVLAEKDVTVSKPLLVVSAPYVTMTYGENAGDLTATAEGWVDGDTAESADFDGNIVFESSSRATVGTYPLTIKYQSDKYDVMIQDGALTILPRELIFAPCQFAKVYDGTTGVDSSKLVLEGLINNDLVTAKVDLEFSDKNVGSNKQVSVVNCVLEGANSQNYSVNCQDTSFFGTITPLNVTLDGVEAADKVFDGTTSVTFINGGALNGVLPSDNVSIGSINAHFVDASCGKNKTVVIESVTLVGEDGENYVVAPTTTTADISGKNKQSVASGT